jgi:hypothetical protein
MPFSPMGAMTVSTERRKIYVTSPGYDDIGQVLRSMNVAHEPFSGSYDCSFLFVNCGTSDTVDPRRLAEFVDSGGCLYVSDLAGDRLALAFPEIFVFDGRGGTAGEIDALVVDRELREISGRIIRIRFDMGAWKVLRHCHGHAIIRSANPGPYADLPIMVSVRRGRGRVFYTCFHNRAQQSVEEKRMLQLLVLKQISLAEGSSVEQVGSSLGVRLDEFRRDFRR